MEFKPPKQKKKNFFDKIKSSVPIKNDHQLIGVFDGLHVSISNWDAMNYIYDEGNFGKGSLSKGKPTYYEKKDDIPKVILEHQFKNESKWDNIQDSTRNSQGFAFSKYQLSSISIKTFLKTALDEKFKKSQEYCNKRDYKNLTGNTNKKINCSRELKLLEFTSDSDPPIDESFKEVVNNVLNSQKLKENFEFSLKEEKVIVVNQDLCNDIDLIVNADVKLEKRSSLLRETLDLNLEESFFLCFALGCLKIVDTNGAELAINDIWHKFNNIQSNFFQRYACYHYYRAKGWVIRSGLKFGGDFLLYELGPSFNHASYLVKVIDPQKILSWKDFMALNRVVETFNKDIVFCTALQEHKVLGKKLEFPDCLKNCNIQEVMSRRWIPSKEKNIKEGKI